MGRRGNVSCCCVLLEYSSRLDCHILSTMVVTSISSVRLNIVDIAPIGELPHGKPPISQNGPVSQARACLTCHSHVGQEEHFNR